MKYFLNVLYMSNTVILTSRNQNSAITNQFTYKFPSTQSFKDHEIALLQFSVYNSFFNIESSRNNNNVTFTFNALVPTVHAFQFANGFYKISDLNYALQNFCLINNLYMIDAVNPSKLVYFIEILANSITYSAQLNFYAIPTSAEATTNQWTIPPNATWDFPTTATTPQIDFNSSFGELLGYVAGTYPPTPLNASQQYLSTVAPVISPISSIFLTCNLISSPYSNPSNIIGNSAITSDFGNLIEMKNSSPIFLSVIPSNYNYIEINMLSQDFAALPLLDKEIVVVLVIREKTKQKLL